MYVTSNLIFLLFLWSNIIGTTAPSPPACGNGAGAGAGGAGAGGACAGGAGGAGAGGAGAGGAAAGAGGAGVADGAAVGIKYPA